MRMKAFGWIPRTPQDRWAFLALLHGAPHMAYYEYCIVYANYYETPIYLNYHLAFYCWILFNIYGNLTMLRLKDITNCKQDCLNQSFSQNGTAQVCQICVNTLPERAHHCKFCNACILKRDHHCWFAGTCVGYANHRYYFWMIVYMWILAVYGNIFNLHHNASELFGYSLWTLSSIPMFHVYFVFGFYTLYQFYIALIMTIGVLLLFLISYLLYAQIVQMRYGQTQFERKKGFKKYNQGIYDNILDIFGERWYLTGLSPFISSKLLGDGYTFKQSNNKLL